MFRQSNTSSTRTRSLSSKPTLPPPPARSQGVRSSAPMLPLSGCIISYTGFTVIDRDVVNTKVRAMGGEINVDLTEDVTHLLVAKAGSQKYKVAFSLGIPVLSPTWLSTLYDRWTKNESLEMKTLTEECSMGPLKGCNICVTGYAQDVRLQIEKESLQYGGKYTNDLHRGKTTHLLCHRANGLKYTSALQWGLHCVPYEWLRDTIISLERADESKYEISHNNSIRSANINAKEPAEPDMDMEPEKPHTVQNQMYLDACYIYVAPGFSPEMATRLKKIIRMGGGIQLVEYQASEVTHVVVPSDTLDASTMALFNQEIDVPYIVNQQWLRQCNRAVKHLSEADYIVPFPTRSVDGQHKPVRFNGATTWTTDSAFKPVGHSTKANTLSKSSPIAAGSNGNSPTSKGHNSANGEKITEYRDKDIGSPASSPTTTPAETPETNSPVELRRGLRNRTMSGMLTDAIGDLSMVSTTQLPTQENSLISKAGNLILEEEEEEENPVPNIFMGLYISTYGWSSEKMPSAIRREVISRGGTFVAEGETPPVALDRIWTIVPLGRSGQSLQHLKTVILTSCWFERSLETERVVPKNEHFLNKPIPVLPIPGFEDLSITVGNGSMREYEYEQVGKAIRHMGAQFSNTLHSKNTNLLITDKAAGPKYETMAKEGKPIVRLQWLKDCVLQGKRLPFQDYLLEAPKSKDIRVKTSVTDLVVTRTRSNGSSRSNSPFDNQLVPVYHAAPTDRILEGQVIYLHGRVEGDHIQMQDMITNMGARLLTSFNSTATHFIHQGKATIDVLKEIKAARRHEIRIVSPKWLYMCLEKGFRVDEKGFPEVYDGHHLTLQSMPSTQPSTGAGASRSSTRGSKSAAISPSLLTSASTSTLSTRLKRSTTTTTYSQLHGGELALTQQQQHVRTAAAVTSSLVSLKREVSSVTQPNSVNTSFDISMVGMMEMTSLRSMGTGSSLPMEEPRPFIDDGGGGIWQPLPQVPVIREERKRRRPQPGTEPSTIPTPQPVAENEERIDYFEKKSKYGDDTIYWDDAEGRQRKRAFYESLGYKIPEKPRTNNAEADNEQDTLRRDLASQAPPQFYFLLTGIHAPDRSRLKRTIKDLGGIVLEDMSQNEETWKAKVTHLVTNGRNPQKTSKLVIASESNALVVNKTFLAESAEQGQFVDETPHLV